MSITGAHYVVDCMVACAKKQAAVCMCVSVYVRKWVVVPGDFIVCCWIIVVGLDYITGRTACFLAIFFFPCSLIYFPKQHIQQ